MNSSPGSRSAPSKSLARELARLEQRERVASQKLADPKVSTKIYVAANAVLNQVHRQKMALLEKAGVNLEAPRPPEIPIDERGLHHVLSSKASLAEIMVAACVDPNTPLEDATEAFGRQRVSRGTLQSDP